MPPIDDGNSDGINDGSQAYVVPSKMTALLLSDDR